MMVREAFSAPFTPGGGRGRAWETGVGVGVGNEHFEARGG